MWAVGCHLDSRMSLLLITIHNYVFFMLVIHSGMGIKQMVSYDDLNIEQLLYVLLSLNYLVFVFGSRCVL